MSGYDYFMYFMENGDRDFVWRYREGSLFGELSWIKDTTWAAAILQRNHWSKDEQVTEADLPEWVIR